MNFRGVTSEDLFRRYVVGITRRLDPPVKTTSRSAGEVNGISPTSGPWVQEDRGRADDLIGAATAISAMLESRSFPTDLWFLLAMIESGSASETQFTYDELENRCDDDSLLRSSFELCLEQVLSFYIVDLWWMLMDRDTDTASSRHQGPASSLKLSRQVCRNWKKLPVVSKQWRANVLDPQHNLATSSGGVSDEIPSHSIESCCFSLSACSVLHKGQLLGDLSSVFQRLELQRMLQLVTAAVVIPLSFTSLFTAQDSFQSPLSSVFKLGLGQ
ncbi:hypothetical protein F2Q69_00016945 [Brassica cretica]|uniref:Uncharacterized protein n=1 Tax=Brassica cretica TaxID=69181 RepID=A0A8S9QUT3_BRACR|nr:hypothetical protein F2Q69_00016945 [Brassica cretica]